VSPLTLAGPSLGPLLPVVLGFIELPVVLELAALPAAKLPLAELRQSHRVSQRSDMGQLYNQRIIAAFFFDALF
jgi:hypothetical protein